MSDLVYLNGEILPREKAKVSIEDRGFLFADGIYEVARCYSGKIFAWEGHYDRLCRGASSLRIPVPLKSDEMRRVAEDLLERNGNREAIVYIQLTRGAAPRAHYFEQGMEPTLVLFTREVPGPNPDLLKKGCQVISAVDNRWGLCYIKTTGLLPNTLAKQAAKEAGAFEALFVRDGFVTEGSSSNCFAVSDGVIRTYPLANILAGITREIVIELINSLGIPLREEAFTLEEFKGADEAFLSGTTTEIMPITGLNGHTFAGGRPGPVTLRVAEAFQRRIDEVRNG